MDSVHWILVTSQVNGACFLIVAELPTSAGATSHIRYVPSRSLVPKGMVFGLNGCRLYPFGLGIGYGFQGNQGCIWTYLPFQFQMNKEERVLCEVEMDFKTFCWRSWHNFLGYPMINLYPVDTAVGFPNTYPLGFIRWIALSNFWTTWAGSENWYRF